MSLLYVKRKTYRYMYKWNIPFTDTLANCCPHSQFIGKYCLIVGPWATLITHEAVPRYKKAWAMLTLYKKFGSGKIQRSSLRNDWPLSEQIPFYQRKLSASWLKLAQWFCGTSFLNVENVYSLFCYMYNFPLENGVICPLYNWNIANMAKNNNQLFEQIWISFTRECYVPILVEISPVVLLHDILKSFQCILSILI